LYAKTKDDKVVPITTEALILQTLQARKLSDTANSCGQLAELIR